MIDETKKERKTTIFDWLRACMLHPEIAGKAMNLRLANAFFLRSDSKTARGYTGNDKLAKTANIPDERNFQKRKAMLVKLGAIKLHPIETYPDEEAVRGFDSNCQWFQLDLQWAEGVLNNPVMGGQSDQGRGGQSDQGRGGQSDQGRGGQSDHPISQTSPTDLEVDLTGGCRPLGEFGAAGASPPSGSSFHSDPDHLAMYSRESEVEGDMDREDKSAIVADIRVDIQNENETDISTASAPSPDTEPAAGVEMDPRARFGREPEWTIRPGAILAAAISMNDFSDLDEMAPTDLVDEFKALFGEAAFNEHRMDISDALSAEITWRELIDLFEGGDDGAQEAAAE